MACDVATFARPTAADVIVRVKAGQAIVARVQPIMFSPNYGAAQQHIATLMQEREDFVAASVAQKAIVAKLNAQVAALTEDLAAAHEQLEVQGLISESRARQIEEQRTEAEATQMKLDKMRSAVYTLWGLLQEMSMRAREQANQITSGSDLLESLSELLKGTDASPAKGR